MSGSVKRKPYAVGQTLLMACCLGLTFQASLTAHEGPPFPILMDEPAAGHIVSVWADPDIGEAQFFIVVETPAGTPPVKLPTVSMWTEPISGRLERVTYEAEQQTLRNQVQFEARPYFDRRDMWTVGFRITAPDGTTEELTTEVESTPPGFGAWDLAVYLFPFLLLGGMWIMAMRRHRQLKSTLQEPPSAPAATPEK